MQREVTRNLLAVLAIGMLIAASLWILRPFLIAMVWAAMIVVPTWPVLMMLQQRARLPRALAIAVMTVAMLLVFVLPFWVGISTIAQYSDQVGTWTKTLRTVEIPQPPAFVEAVPYVGPKIAAAWRDAVSAGWEPLVVRAKPYVGQAIKWLATEAGSLGALVIQFLLTVIIAAVMYANGEAAAAGLRRFGRRLAGTRGEQSVVLAGQAVRGVALGVVVTALVQSLLGGIGLAFSGIPLAGVLTVLMLMLCLAQIGVLPVLVPAVAWLFWAGDNVSATLLLIWSVFVGTLDNFLRPFLIKRGADLPLLLIFAGVIGGLLAFGLLGIFVGPVVLAVTFTLLESWVNETPPEAHSAGEATAPARDGAPSAGNV
jgi:predicted PurR-regulated permease PerM